MSRQIALGRAVGIRSAVVSGHFDPLLAQHARRLREIRARFERLIVLIADPDEPVLDARSRAELLAALDCIDCVVLPPCSIEEFENMATVFREEREHEDRFRELMDHVRLRHAVRVEE